MSTLFLCGDVMTGRGIDQILPRSCPPDLYETYMTSAEGYVTLAVRAGAALPPEPGWDYVWGDALEVLEQVDPDVRVINLETAVTCHPRPWRKAVNYRMHPGNTPLLTEAGVDCAVLANNHVLDWQEPGLLETLEALEEEGVATAGAGRGLAEARAPVGLELRDGRRLLVFALAAPDAGIPAAWAAAPDRPGVHYLPDYGEGTLERVVELVQDHRRPGDVVVASIHWGSNWGYGIPPEHRRFAHGLVDRAGVDVIHGHSSHHPRAGELYRGRLILYGCGDFLNDYEGIGGREEFRGELVLMYFVTLPADPDRPVGLRMIPLEISSFRLQRTSPDQTRWMQERMDREYGRFGGGVRRVDEGVLELQPEP